MVFRGPDVPLSIYPASFAGHLGIRLRLAELGFLPTQPELTCPEPTCLIAAEWLCTSRGLQGYLPGEGKVATRPLTLRESFISEEGRQYWKHPLEMCVAAA